MKKVSIAFDLLERIANYYEFSITAFFYPKKMFPKRKTRHRELLKRIETIKTGLKRIIDDN